jgi:glyoxylase-like metal-dependent hydrolase (beta-lactamase superfamily II)
MRKIAAGVYSIAQTGLRAYPSGYVRAYLLDKGNELTLIDTLADPDAHLIFEALESINRPVTDVKHIVITHAHWSHLGGLAFLKRASGATVYAHEWEADIIAGDRKAQPVSLWPTAPIIFPQRVGLALGFPSAAACHIDRPLNDGDAIGPVQVMHTPGHTPGSVIFYWPERQAVFAGDNIATWPRFGAGWPSFQLNENEFRRSFVRLVKEFEPCMQLIGVGHGEPIIERAAERVRCLLASVW